MIIMFILMFAPLFGLPVFWFLPPAEAVPVYLVCVALSAWMFWLMRRNKRYPVVTGREGMIGREAEVVSRSTTGDKSEYTIHVEGELWTARSNEGVQPGEKVLITAIKGNTPIIKRKDNGTGGLSQ
jgi:membrane protein implicated in regulation of membrane protease activity